MSTVERRIDSGSGQAGGGPEAVLRPMRAADLPPVLAIERASFTMAWSAGTFRSLLGRPDAEAWVAERGARIVGYAVFWVVLDEAELGDIAVHPAERRAGTGTLLLRHVIRRARERGVRLLYLEVRESNLDAQRLYRRWGFRSSGRRPRYYTEPVEDALVFGLELEPGRPDAPAAAD